MPQGTIRPAARTRRRTGGEKRPLGEAATWGGVYVEWRRLRARLGGELSKTQAAIDEDLRLLSRYFPRIRTHASQFYGVEIAPIAAKYGLRVHLGVAMVPQFFVHAETVAAVRAVRSFPATVEAIILGDTTDLFIDVPARGIRDKMDEIKHQLGPELARGLQFGTLMTNAIYEWRSPLTDLRSLIGVVDFFGVSFQPDIRGFSTMGPLDHFWQEGRKHLDRSHLRVLNVEFATTSPRFDPSGRINNLPNVVRYFEALAVWRPTDSVVVFWDQAFDPRRVVADLTHASWSGTGLFTWDRRRKHPRLPLALSPYEDPIRLPRQPLEPSCPEGMYQMIVNQFEVALVACQITGYNLRSPIKFDERLLRATCENDYCRLVIDALKAIPAQPPCPFDDQVTETMLHTLILDPIDEHCGARQPSPMESVMPYPWSIVNGCSIGGAMFALSNDTSQSERCHVISGFDGSPLTQSVLEKMCWETSCELIMQQLANPHRPQTMMCPDEPRRRDQAWIEENIVKPYFDGCYRPSMMAGSYFDTAYRERKTRPLLPSLEPPTEPPLSMFPTSPPVIPRTIPNNPLSASASRDDSCVECDQDDPESTGANSSIQTASATKRRRPASAVANEDSQQDDPAGPEVSFARVSSRVTPVSSKHPAVLHIASSPVVDDGEAVSSAGPRFHLPRSRHENWSRIVLTLSGITAMTFIVMVFALRRPPNASIAATDDYERFTDDVPAEVDDAIDQRPRTGSVRPFWADSALVELFIHPDRLRDVKIIGSGAQALVYLVRWDLETTSSAPTPRYLAAKRLTKASVTTDPDVVAHFVREIKLVAALRHPTIVSLVGITWSTGWDVQALYEYMAGGDLCDYLSRTPWAPWTSSKLQWALDVIEALVYTHTQSPPIVHRDVKSRNVLLTASGSDESPVNAAMSPRLRPIAKLTDFGVSRQLSTNATMTTGIGTGRWLAPEVILGGGDYDESSDVYSFGVLLSELDTHALPFVERRTPTGDLLPHIALLQMVAMEGVTPAFMGSSPVALVALAHECLAYDPTKRPRAAEVARRLREVLARGSL